MRGGRRLRYAAAAAMASACWAFGITLIKLLSARFTPSQQNLARYLSAAVFLLATYQAARGTSPLSLSRLKRAAIPAVIAFFFQEVATLSVYLTSVATVSFMMRLNVVFLALIAFAMYRDERRLAGDPAFWAGLAAGLVGVWGLVSRGGGLRLDLGAVLAAASAVLWAVYSVAVKHYVRSENPLAYSSAVYLVAGLMFTPLAVADTLRCGWPRASPLEEVLLVLSGVVSIGAGNWMNITAIKGLGAVLPSMIQMATPFLATLFSFALLGEPVTARELAFGCMVLAGSAATLKYALLSSGRDSP